MPEDSTPAPHRIAVWQTVKDSYRATFSKQVLRMPFLWLPIVMALLGASMNYQFIGGADAPALAAQQMTSINMGQGLLLAIVVLLQCLFMLTLAISWQRYLLRGETPSGAYFGGALWRYLGFTMVVAFCASLVFLSYGLLCVVTLGPLGIMGAITALIGATHDDAGTEVLLLSGVMGLAIMIAAIWAAIGLVPKFVALAVDDERVTWKQSFRLMRGNTLRYLGGSILAMILLVIPALLVMLVSMLPVLVAGGGVIQSLVSALLVDGVLTGCLGVVQILIISSYMALAYRQLVPGPIPDRALREQ